MSERKQIAIVERLIEEKKELKEKLEKLEAKKKKGLSALIAEDLMSFWWDEGTSEDTLAIANLLNTATEAIRRSHNFGKDSEKEKEALRVLKESCERFLKYA